MLTVLIHPVNILHRVKKSAYLTPIPVIIVSEGVEKTKY